jgi:hypothetical protein
MRTRSGLFCLMLLALTSLLPANSAFCQTRSGSQADLYRDLARQDRAHASDAYGRAQQYSDLATKARARAVISSGSLKDVWEQSADNDEAEAKRLKDEGSDWENKAAELDIEARQAEAQAAPAATAAASGSGPNVPLGGLEAPASPAAPAQIGQTSSGVGPNPLQQKPATGATAQPTPAENVASNPAENVASNATCPQTPSAQPISIDQITGTWTDSATGKEVEISNSSGDTITVKGEHDWQGNYSEGELKASRYPKVNEMSGAPPGLKSEQVEGKVKWELELEAKYDCGGLVLEGKWYPGEYKWSSKTDTDSSRPPQVTVSDFRRGQPILVKFAQPPPAIAAVIVMEDQSTIVGGLSKYPYPFQPDVSPSLNVTRTLFICGRGLPKNWRRKISFESDSNLHVDYTPTAIWRDPTSAGPYSDQLFAKGFDQVTRELDADLAAQVRKLDAMLVKVSLQPGVVPGIKEFRLNGANGAWTLQFGDQRSMFSFARDVSVDSEDVMLEDGFLPERIFLELRTLVPLPIDNISLRVWVNEKEVHWAGGTTLVAYRDSKNPTVYRTQYIELVENGRPLPSPETGVFYLPVKLGDMIYARIEDPNLLWTAPAVPRIKVRRTPAELGLTWKEALARAAKADNIRPPVSNWSELSGQRATDVANYIVSELALKAISPIAAAAAENGLRTSLGTGERRTLRITVGDHAAMLLLREELVEQLEDERDELQRKIGTLGVRGFRELINVAPWDEKFQWRYLQVSGAGSPWYYLRRMIDMYEPDVVANIADAELPSWSLPYAISDDYLKKKFGDDKQAADRYVQQAVQEGLDQYLRAVDFAIKKIRTPTESDQLLKTIRGFLPLQVQFLIPDYGLPDEDVPGLLTLLGLWYAPLVPHVAPRLMKLSTINNRLLWTPELAGRYVLDNLNVVADAVQAQQNYSNLDTAEAMLFASMVVTPFAAGEGLLGSAVTCGADCAFFEVSLATEVPEFFQQRQDFTVALGSSIALGTSRLKEEELKRTEWFSVLTSVGMNALGAALSTTQMVGMIRTHLMVSSVETGGLQAFEKLSTADQAAFWRYATEAKIIEEAGDTKMLTEWHRRTSRAADKVVAEIAEGLLKKASNHRIDAIGQVAPPTPREIPKPESGNGLAKAETVVIPEGELGAAKAETVELSEPKPGEANGESRNLPESNQKTSAVQNLREGGHTREIPPIEPQAGTSDNPFKWRTTYEGRPKIWELGGLIGEGGSARVFELVNPDRECGKPCVIKIYPADTGNAVFQSGKEIVSNTQRGADWLGEIPQKKIIRQEPDAPMPYIIQERLQAGEEHFETNVTATDPETGKPIYKDGIKQKTLNMEAYNLFRSDKDLQRSVVELFYQIASKGLIWEDGHLGNMYFFKDRNGKWVAGVLDQDRIIPFSLRGKEGEGEMGLWIAWVEAQGMPRKCRSMYKSLGNIYTVNDPRVATPFFNKNRGPFFPDQFYFMEKMFEYKGWLNFDDFSGEFTSGFLDPEIIREKFPDMFKNTNSNAINPRRLDALPLITKDAKPVTPQEIKAFWNQGVRLSPLQLIPHSRSQLASFKGPFEDTWEFRIGPLREAA